MLNACNKFHSKSAQNGRLLRLARLYNASLLYCYRDFLTLVPAHMWSAMPLPCDGHMDQAHPQTHPSTSHLVLTVGGFHFILQHHRKLLSIIPLYLLSFSSTSILFVMSQGDIFAIEVHVCLNSSSLSPLPPFPSPCHSVVLGCGVGCGVVCHCPVRCGR